EAETPAAPATRPRTRVKMIRDLRTCTPCAGFVPVLTAGSLRPYTRAPIWPGGALQPLERLPRARAPHRGGASVDEEGDAECLGDLLVGGSPPRGRLGVVGDAAVAVLHHGDGEGDELLRLRGERTVGHRLLVELPEARPHPGDGVAERAGGGLQVGDDGRG